MTQASGSGLTLKGRAIAGIACGLAFVAATLVVRDTIIRIKGDKRDYSIEVAGAAKRTVKATRLGWSAAISLKTRNVSDGHITLEEVRERLRAFLVTQGVDAHAILFPAVEVREETEWDTRLRRTISLGHVLTQRIRVEAAEVTILQRVDGHSADMIAAGQIGGEEFIWQPEGVRYEYDNFDGIKQQVLSAAVQNARVRASSMADAAGVRLAELRQIELGDIQVRSPGSSSRYADDAESPTKDVICDVKLLYHVAR